MENSIEDSKEEALKRFREILYSEDTKSSLLAIGLNTNNNETVSVIKGEPKLLVTVLFKAMLNYENYGELINVTSHLYETALKMNLVEKFNRLEFNELSKLVNDTIELFSMASKEDIEISMTDNIINPFAQA